MDIISLFNMVVVRVLRLAYPRVIHQLPYPFPIPSNFFEDFMTTVILSQVSSTWGGRILILLDRLLSDVVHKFAHTLSGPPLAAYLEPTKELPRVNAKVVRMRLQMKIRVSPTMGLCYPPTPTLEAQPASDFACFVALLICMSVASLITLWIVQRRLNVGSRPKDGPVVNRQFFWFQMIFGWAMAGLAYLRDNVMAWWAFAGQKSSNSTSVASGLHNVYASPEGNVDKFTTTLATDGLLILGSLSFLVFSPSFENLMTPSMLESGRPSQHCPETLKAPDSDYVVWFGGEAQRDIEPRKLKSALKTKPKPLRNVYFSKADRQVFDIPHRLDNPWERDAVVVVPRVGILKTPGTPSRGYRVRWAAQICTWYIEPRQNISWETLPWHEAFWNDDG